MTRRRSGSRGSILIFTCLVLLALVGIAGFTIDAGHLMLVKNELRSFADSASLSAALQLDGTAEGIRRAKAAITNSTSGPHALKWDMGTRPVSKAVLSFAKASEKSPDKPDEKTWSEIPTDPGAYRFARVEAHVDVSMIFMGRGSSGVAVTVVAGQDAKRDVRLVQ